MENEQISVLEFHQAFDIIVNDEPTIPDWFNVERALRLISEEWKELQDAACKEDIVEVADAIADLVYVLKGMAVSYGIDLEHVFREVHQSNMTKVGGTK